MVNPFGYFIGMVLGSLTSLPGLIAALVIGLAVPKWWMAAGLGAIAGMVAVAIGMASNGVLVTAMLAPAALAFAGLATLIWVIAALGRRRFGRGKPEAR